VSNKTVWTIGHSTHPFDEFLSMLASFQIQHLVDIRRFPGSKRFPQYNKDHLAQELPKYGIEYTHMGDLGGRRNPAPDSINTSWRVKAFRGYADYMQTEPFIKAISELENMGGTQRCAYMCSEAVWWSCHRSLVSDYLKAAGWGVFHIITKDKLQEHPYTKAASLVHGVLNYSENI